MTITAYAATVATTWKEISKITRKPWEERLGQTGSEALMATQAARLRIVPTKSGIEWSLSLLNGHSEMIVSLDGSMDFPEGAGAPRIGYAGQPWPADPETGERLREEIFCLLDEGADFLAGWRMIQWVDDAACAHWAQRHFPAATDPLAAWNEAASLVRQNASDVDRIVAVIDRCVGDKELAQQVRCYVPRMSPERLVPVTVAARRIEALATVTAHTDLAAASAHYMASELEAVRAALPDLPHYCWEQRDLIRLLVKAEVGRYAQEYAADLREARDGLIDLTRILTASSRMEGEDLTALTEAVDLGDWTQATNLTTDSDIDIHNYMDTLVHAVRGRDPITIGDAMQYFGI